MFIPHTIIGDLDSADDDVLNDYGHYGVEIIKDDEQGWLAYNFSYFIQVFLFLINLKSVKWLSTWL